MLNYEQNIFKLQKERSIEQKKVFTKWINHQLRNIGLHLDDLYNDLRDGKILLKLLEYLSGENIASFHKSQMKIFKIENINNCLAFIKHKGLNLQSISAENVYDGDPDLILGLIWTIILRFQIENISINVDESNINSKKKTSKDALLLWCQRRTRCYKNVKINNFGTSWTSGLAFNALIHTHKPNLFDYESLNPIAHKDNLEHALNIADKQFGIPKLLEAEDIERNISNEESIVTYLTSYFHNFSSMVHYEKLEVQEEQKLTAEVYVETLQTVEIYEEKPQVVEELAGKEKTIGEEEKIQENVEVEEEIQIVDVKLDKKQVIKGQQENQGTSEEQKTNVEVCEIKQDCSECDELKENQQTIEQDPKEQETSEEERQQKQEGNIQCVVGKGKVEINIEIQDEKLGIVKEEEQKLKDTVDADKEEQQCIDSTNQVVECIEKLSDGLEKDIVEQQEEKETEEGLGERSQKNVELQEGKQHCFECEDVKQSVEEQKQSQQIIDCHEEKSQETSELQEEKEQILAEEDQKHNTVEVLGQILKNIGVDEIQEQCVVNEEGEQLIIEDRGEKLHTIEGQKQKQQVPSELQEDTQQIIGDQVEKHNTVELVEQKQIEEVQKQCVVDEGEQLIIEDREGNLHIVGQKQNQQELCERQEEKQHIIDEQYEKYNNLNVLEKKTKNIVEVHKERKQTFEELDGKNQCFNDEQEKQQMGIEQEEGEVEKQCFIIEPNEKENTLEKEKQIKNSIETVEVSKEMQEIIEGEEQAIKFEEKQHNVEGEEQKLQIFFEIAEKKQQKKVEKGKQHGSEEQGPNSQRTVEVQGENHHTFKERETKQQRIEVEEEQEEYKKNRLNNDDLTRPLSEASSMVGLPSPFDDFLMYLFIIVLLSINGTTFVLFWRYL